MRAAAMLLAALALAAAFAGPATPSTPASGLRGIVLRGPTEPVCVVDDPCEAPAAGIVLQFSRAGTVAARVQTGPAGGYAVRLRAGVYAVSTPAARIGSALTPRRVRVLQGRVTRVDFHLDTGIQ